MKKFFIILLTTVFSVSVFAQEFKISGEVKGSILWEKIENKQVVVIRGGDLGKVGGGGG